MICEECQKNTHETFHTTTDMLYNQSLCLSCYIKKQNNEALKAQ